MTKIILDNLKKNAYIEDNLYNIVADKIGRLYKEITKPVSYQKNENINR